MKLYRGFKEKSFDKMVQIRLMHILSYVECFGRELKKKADRTLLPPLGVKRIFLLLINVNIQLVCRYHVTFSGFSFGFIVIFVQLYVIARLV